MRFDKLTTKLQAALANAQSLAVRHDNQYIEPAHILLALLADDDMSASSLLQRAGVNVAALTAALNAALGKFAKVSGNAGEVQFSRESSALLNLAEKESQQRGDQFLASEIVLLAFCD